MISSLQSNEASTRVKQRSPNARPKCITSAHACGIGFSRQPSRCVAAGRATDADRLPAGSARRQTAGHRKRLTTPMVAFVPSSYAHEKLLAALESLASGPGDVRERLLAAYQTFHPLKQSHFPPDLRKDFEWVLRQLTKHKPIYDYKRRLDRGSVEETLRCIKNVTGVKIATRIYRLYHALDSEVRRKPAPFTALSQTDGRKRKARKRTPRSPAVRRER